MGDPHPAELSPAPEDLSDPTGERALRPLPFFVRKHRDRGVALASARCFFYCRFCFRRGEAPSARPTPTEGEWAALVRWLDLNPEVTEVILSGGDPLTLSDRHLGRIGGLLAKAGHLGRWRIHTRAPVVLPRRVTPRLIAALETRLPLRIAIHVNHPAEIRPAFLGAVETLQRAGIEVLSQSVLLTGVNDRPETLLELFGRLAAAGIRPHYLHHPDRAPGNGRFRLPIGRGLAIYREVLAGGGEVPPYVLDLPNGAGKCPVQDLIPVAREAAPSGMRTRYRWRRPPGWDALVEDEGYEWWDVAGPDPGDAQRCP